MKLNSIDMFSSLPHLMKREDGEICEYDDRSTPEYIATLSEYDDEWHIDWVSEKGDSIQNIADKDISLAIYEAYAWCVDEGFLRDLDSYPFATSASMEAEINELDEMLYRLSKSVADSQQEVEKDFLRRQYEIISKYRYMLKRQFERKKKYWI